MLLARCSTVDEARKLLASHVYRGNASQILVADRGGDSLAGDWLDGEFREIHREGDFQAMTNFHPLKKDEGGWPCRRFETAGRMLAETKEASVDSFAAILEATATEGAGHG